MFSNIYKVFKVSWKKYIMYIINDIILFNVQGKMNSINILLFYWAYHEENMWNR